jgi:acyl dehydratase
MLQLTRFSEIKFYALGCFSRGKALKFTQFNIIGGIQMSDLTKEVPGMYFEEFEIGQRVVTPARTVTESDVVSFAGLSGDYQQIHTDAEFSRGTPYEQRVVHGLLIMSIASGLITRTGVLEGTVLAFREINNWKFSYPVFFGDTIHVELVVIETKALPRLGGGSIVIELSVLNQDGRRTMKGKWTALVASTP